MWFHKFKVYAKLVLIILVAIFVILFMFANRQTARVDLIFVQYEMPTYAFVFIVANVGWILFLIIKHSRKIISEVRQTRRESQIRQSLVGRNTSFDNNNDQDGSTGNKYPPQT